MSNSNSNIYTKPCVYNCGVQIFWNTATNEYWEVFTKKKHICPNRINKSVTVTNKPSHFSNEKPESINHTSYPPDTTTTSTKPTYYSKKPWLSQAKPKMSNSFELLTGPIETIQQKYEILSDIVSEYNGKVHGSQSHNVTNNSLSLIVYYEVHVGQRDEVKRKFENFVRNIIALQRN